MSVRDSSASIHLALSKLHSRGRLSMTDHMANSQLPAAMINLFFAPVFKLRSSCFDYLGKIWASRIIILDMNECWSASMQSERASRGMEGWVLTRDYAGSINCALRRQLSNFCFNFPFFCTTTTRLSRFLRSSAWID
jgi:hypothetical protein